MEVKKDVATQVELDAEIADLPAIFLDHASSLTIDDSDFANCGIGIKLLNDSYLNIATTSEPLVGTNNDIGYSVSRATLDLESSYEFTATTELSLDNESFDYVDLDTASGILCHPITGSRIIRYGTTLGDSGREVFGVATFAASTSEAVTFTVPFADTSYAIQLSPSINVTAYYEDKATTGFTILTSAEATGEVSWRAVKL